jgi:hypothetical protein
MRSGATNAAGAAGVGVEHIDDGDRELARCRSENEWHGDIAP